MRIILTNIFAACVLAAILSVPHTIRQIRSATAPTNAPSTISPIGPTTIMRALDSLSLQAPLPYYRLPGFSPAPTSIPASDHLFAITLPKLNANFRFVLTMSRASLRVMGTPSLRPSQADSPSISEPGVVFLVVRYSNGDYVTGTGSIVAGHFAHHRVLTARHVIAPPDGVLVESITAFSPAGDKLATLAIAPDGCTPAPPSDPLDFTHRALDAEVLMPTSFATPGTQAAWNGAGLILSPIQPAHLLYITSGANSALLNPGISGGPVRNSAGHIVGIITTANANAGTAYHPHRASRYLAALRNARGGGTEHEAVAHMAKRRAEAISLIGAAGGFANPVADPAIWARLGVDGIATSDRVSSFAAHAAGYPNLEALSGPLFATPMRAFPVSALLGAPGTCPPQK